MNYTSSLIDLKAELSKKREEAQKAPQKTVNFREGGYKWKYLAQKLDYRRKITQLTRKCEKAGNEIEKRAAEEGLEKAIRESKEALERKVKIYEQKMDKAMQGFFQDSDEEAGDEEDECLVNFDAKALEKCKLLNQKRREALSKSQECFKPKDDSQHDSDDHGDDDDEWTEFTDSLGRTRKCLKADLHLFIKADEDLTRSQSPSAKRFRSEDSSSTAYNDWKETIPPSEPQGPIHYQNIRFDEVRDHGVGFYQFSKDAEQRKKQMEELKELREQTIKQQEMKIKMDEKKSQLVQQRLARIAARRGIQIPNSSNANVSKENVLNEKT
ncbi:coiled-coil domain-containing protein 174 isoform X2 [Brevipalpus obovatus]|uniref:coiled-coil domain-containing protein 174 isoform X2 n=1 Tax=Brevipalpus obovatus TaxID=246614 RepID=UPI003D9F05FD